MEMLGIHEDTSGPAADTGSAMHAAVAEWHKTNRKSVRDAINAMRSRLIEFPAADLPDAELQFQCYADDPRNHITPIIIEHKLTFKLDPATEDPTGQPITVIGTVDQVREEDGVLKIWDLKSSKKMGFDILVTSLLQVTAYALGATQLLGKCVHPGGIIRTRGYITGGTARQASPMGVFYHAFWSFYDAPALLASVQHAVAAVRMGRITLMPGEYCRWCPSLSPEKCLPSLQETMTHVRSAKELAQSSQRIQLPTS